MGIREKKEERVVVYARVSSSANKANLATQTRRLVDYCAARGYRVHKVISEFGSGLNDTRPKLEKLLQEQDFTKLIIEHKDRLTRFGFNYIETMLNKNNIEIEVLNPVLDDEADIIQDFTSFCARIYGKRRSKRKTEN